MVVRGVLFLLLCFTENVPASTHFLFSDCTTNSEGVEPPSIAGTVRQVRVVTIAEEVKTGEGLVPGDQLVFDLFDEGSLAAEIDRLGRNVNGTVSVRGRIAGYPLATILVSTTEGRTLASIDIPELGESYAISGGSDGTHILTDLDATQMDFLEDSPPLIAAGAGLTELVWPPSEETEPLKGPLDPATIDILVVYTPAARTWANNSGGGIANVISQAMEKGQLALDNSNTTLTVRLAHSAEISYTESGDSGTDLDRLTSSVDGYMDTVGTLRTQYKADLVCLFASVSDTGGIAWLLGRSGGDPSTGFSLVRVQQAASGYTQIHEMGHNMACGHHKQQTTQPGPGLFDYSAGWRWTGTDGGRYCSVMTYASGSYFADGLNHTTVGYFSNPAISYKGLPTGHSDDGDNARTIREVKHAVAAYRNNKVPLTPNLIHPANGASGMTQNPTLKASAFSDPDGDSHANSQWQVDNNSDFSSPEWDSGNTFAAGTEVTVPSNRLNTSTRYSWRVRYKDSFGDWSLWSSSRTFTTQTLYSGGTGTETDPFRIGKVADWLSLTQSPDDWKGYFILTTDLDLSGTTIGPVGSDTATSAGFQGTTFTGDFNGNRHVIRNPSIQSPNQDYVGLFGYIGSGGRIRNLGILGATILGGKNVGGLAAWNERGTLSQCYAIGTIVGTESVGGLAGCNWIGTIENCYAGGSVTGTKYVGGLVGGNPYYGEITYCYSSGSVTGSSITGGLTGWNFRGLFTECFWDMQASGQLSSAAGTGKTTAEMMTAATFTEVGWDLVGESANGTADLWRICTDTVRYPQLSWEFFAERDPACPDGVTIEDLLYLASRWMAATPETVGAADLTDDGRVGVEDLAALAEYWIK